MEATLVTVDGNKKRINVNSFCELKNAVCSNFYLSPLQVVYLNDGRVMALDEEGKMKDLQENQFATDLCHEHDAIFPSDYIVGDVLIFDCVEDIESLF